MLFGGAYDRVLKESELILIMDNIDIVPKIKTLMRSMEYEQALALCSLPCLALDQRVQIQKIKILFLLGRENEALEICDSASFINASHIQVQKICWLVSQGKLQEALAICNRSLFLDDEVIQIQRIKILISLKQFNEALRICDNPKFCSNVAIHNLQRKIKSVNSMDILSEIKTFVKARKYEQALALCSLPYLALDRRVQMRKIKILFLLGKENEALEICDSVSFINDSCIQVQKICWLVSQDKLQDALAICNRSLFLDDEVIQVQKIKILDSLKQFNEALRICDNPKFRRSTVVFAWKKKLELKCGRPQNIKETEEYKLCSLGYRNLLTRKAIEESNLSEFKKIILLCMYFEKYKSLHAVSFLKSKINAFAFTDYEKKVLQKCLERVQSKKPIFDQGFYNDLLFSSSFIVFEEPKEEKVVETVEKEKIQVMKKKDVLEKNMKKDKKKATYIVIEGKRNSQNIETKKSKKNLERTKISDVRDVTIREEYYEGVFALEKEIYKKMYSPVLQVRLNAVKAWTILESITSKSIEDTLAVEKLQRILAKYEAKNEQILVRKK